MPNINRIIAEESNISSSLDDLGLLVSDSSLRQLAIAIMDRLYASQNKFFNGIIKGSSYLGEYDFGVVKRAFAEYSVASTRLNKGRSRYFMNKVFNVNGTDLYLSGEWYAISRAKPKPNLNWPSINDLIKVLNACFDANFVYIEFEKQHQLWGPLGTL